MAKARAGSRTRDSAKRARRRPGANSGATTEHSATRALRPSLRMPRTGARSEPREHICRAGPAASPGPSGHSFGGRRSRDLFPDFGHLNPTPLSRDGTPRRPATDPREAEPGHARLHAGARARIVSTVGLSRRREADTPRARPACSLGRRPPPASPRPSPGLAEPRAPAVGVTGVRVRLVLVPRLLAAAGAGAV